MLFSGSAFFSWKWWWPGWSSTTWHVILPEEKDSLLCLLVISLLSFCCSHFLMTGFGPACSIPGPHSLQAFDPAKPRGWPLPWAWLLGLCWHFFFPINGEWKASADMSPRTAPFFPETYGRISPSHPKTLKWVAQIVPPFYLTLMTLALITIFVKPVLIVPLRSVQKNVYFYHGGIFLFCYRNSFNRWAILLQAYLSLGYLLKRIDRIRKR